MELETFFTVPEQTRLLLYAVLLGIPLGMGFDVLRTLRLLLPHGKLATALEDVSFLLVWAAALLCFSTVLARGEFRGYYWMGSALGFLYPGMRHRAAAAPDLFGSGQVFPAAVPAAVPRCCADLHPVEPEIWTFRQTFSKSIFFFAFTLAER